MSSVKRELKSLQKDSATEKSKEIPRGRTRSGSSRDQSATATPLIPSQKTDPPPEKTLKEGTLEQSVEELFPCFNSRENRGESVETILTPETEFGTEPFASPEGSIGAEQILEHTQPHVTVTNNMSFTKEQMDEIAKIVDQMTSGQQKEISDLKIKLQNTEIELRNTQQQLHDAQISTPQSIVDPVAELVSALSGLRASSAAPISPPRFDSRKVTAKNFLKRMEDFLKLLNFSETDFKFAVRGYLPHDCKSWYDANAANFQDWDDFKVQFETRFDSNLEKCKRLSILTTRCQSVNDPTETFIYEQLELAKNCFPGVEEKDLIPYIQDSLHPRLLAIIGTNYSPSVTDLIRDCEIATKRLVDVDRMEKKKIDVPYMQPDERRSGSSHSQKYEEEADGSGVASQRDASTSKENNSRGGYKRRGNSGNGRSRRGRREESNKDDNQVNLQSQRDSSSSASSQHKPNPPQNPLKCFRCQGYGHKQKDCPSDYDYAMLLAKQAEESEEESETPLYK